MPQNGRRYLGGDFYRYMYYEISEWVAILRFSKLRFSKFDFQKGFVLRLRSRIYALLPGSSGELVAPAHRLHAAMDRPPGADWLSSRKCNAIAKRPDAPRRRVQPPAQTPSRPLRSGRGRGQRFYRRVLWLRELLQHNWRCRLVRVKELALVSATG